MNALRSLLTGAIDYAGLFPPAALDLPEAVRNYDAYRRGPDAWALGRFVIPAARVGELAGYPESREWKLSVLATPLAAVPPGCDSIEMKVERAEDIREAAASLAAGVTPYFEIPIERDPAPLIDAVALAGARAKVRTGGVTAESFPSPESLARFLHVCSARQVAFKATAGLHHPIRHTASLGMMHGFVNVFLAATLALFHGAVPDLVATLEETSAPAFQFHEDGVRWHGHDLTSSQIVAAREQFAISFGSCSFEEPLADSRSLGWL